MKRVLSLLTLIMVFAGAEVYAQSSILDPNDVIVEYNKNNPPATPANGTIAKWVRTKNRITWWNTDKFKPYIYNGMSFRLRFPNGYNANDNTKKYPVILFLHGAGETQPIYDNEDQLYWGAQQLQEKIDSAQFNAFLLFPQQSVNSWDFSYYTRINGVLDYMEQNVHSDPDRQIIMGLSNGGFGSMAYAAGFPQRSASIIASSPAVLELLMGTIPTVVHIPYWVASGGLDTSPGPEVVNNYVNALKAQGGDTRYSFYPDLGHGTWTQMWLEPPLVPIFNTAHKANPLIFNGKSQYCANAVTAHMGITQGFAEYQWRVNGNLISNSNSNEIIGTQLGSYQARFRRVAGGAWSEWSLVPAVITALPPGVSPPISVSGTRSVVLPAPDGSTTTPLELPTGFVSYEWRRASDSVIVSTSRTYAAPVGQYIAKATNCASSFSPVFTVYSATAGTPRPDSARNLTLTRLSSTSIRLNWTDVAAPVANETGFEIYRANNAGGPYTMAGLVGADIKTYTDAGISSNYNFYYRVRAINLNGASGLSNEASLQPVSDGTAPSVPTNIQAIFTSPNFIDLAWTAATDNVGVTSYDVYVNGVKKYTTTVPYATADSLTPNINYSFAVAARDQAGNVSAISTTTSAVTRANGLKYHYYEGSYTTLPDFSTLTAAASGATPNFDITVRPPGVITNYAFVWEGYIHITTPGTYTFETASDDGSKLYYNSFYTPGATPLVNNDGIHGAISVTGSVNITDTGLHSFAVTYFQQFSGQSVQVYWTGPGIARQLIPNSAFVGGAVSSDATAPTAPTNLLAGSISNTAINLTWTASTDNVGVVGYDIYVNGVKKYTSVTNSVTADSLTAGTPYAFTVKARDLAGNNSAFSTTLTASTSGVTSSTAGLNYKYYQGTWTALPDFNALTPVSTGISSNVDIAVRPSGVNDNFAFLWQGYIYIPTAGSYTFETSSDDGSKLYFNSVYLAGNTATVNNDGAHAATPVAGTVNVATAGYYPIAITYFEATGGESMQVFWTGPGIARQLIPNTAFFTAPPAATDTTAPSAPANLKLISVSQNMVSLHWDASTDNVGVVAYDVYRDGVKKYTTTTTDIIADTLVANVSYTFTVKARDLAGNNSLAGAGVAATTISSSTANGLKYRYFEGAWDALPNFNALTPVKTGVSSNIDLTVRNKVDSSGIVWEGFINIQTAGTYTFETVSNEGSKLYFNSLYAPGVTALVNNDSIHLARSVSASVAIPAVGLYPIAITYFDKTGLDSMKVYWTGPGFTRQLIPNAAFTAAGIPAGDVTAPTVPVNLKVISVSQNMVSLHWDASTDNVGVVAYDVYRDGVKKYTTTATDLIADTLVANVTYSFTVTARDLAGNTSVASAAVTPTTITSSSANGLNYRYYEGAWNALPNFNTLTPVKTGVSPTLDLSVRNKVDSFGIVWEGFINIQTPGSYTFETVSDEGSKFYFNSLYAPGATALVNNDSIHLARSASGTVAIPAAGLYPIAISYFDKTGLDSMKLYWTGPGITRQLIPNAAFTATGIPTGDVTAPTVPANLKVISVSQNMVSLHWDASTDNIAVVAYDVYRDGVKKYTTTGTDLIADTLVANVTYSFTVQARDFAGNASLGSAAVAPTTISSSTASGLNYRYYEGAWDALPNFNALTPVKTGASPNIDLSVRNKADSSGIVWEGFINIQTPGSYTFETVSDEGSKFYFNSLYAPGATALVNNDSIHLARSASGTVAIPAAGLYPIAISYFDKTGLDSMKLYWTGPGIARQLIPNAAFTATGIPTGDVTAPTVPANLKVISVSQNMVSLHWDASTDNVGVVAYDVYRGGVKKYTTTGTDLIADTLLANTNYSFTVTARDLAGNTSLASAAVAPTTITSSTANGLNYRYYEGAWDVLPNYNALTPVKTGVSTNVDLSVRNKVDSSGIVWEGFINIQTPGSYTFETVSNEGSKLYFNSLYAPAATALVNNDSIHLARSASGTVAIGAAGLYPIAISYFDKTGLDSMKVYWTGPGIARQLIPNAAFTAAGIPQADTSAPTAPTNLAASTITNTSVILTWTASTDNVGVVAYDVYVGANKKYTTTTTSVLADTLVASTPYSFTVRARDLAGNTSLASAALPVTTAAAPAAVAGLNYKFYQGSYSALPNFNTLTPVKTGTSPNVDISVRTAGVNDNFAFVWEGYINVPVAGTYTFETISDDGSKLYFNSLYSPAATATVNNDGLHAATSVTGTVNVVTPGYYPISITYLEATGGESMQVFWTGPGVPRQLIPNSAFASQLPPDATAPSAPTNVAASLINSTFINLTWTASTDNIGVTGYDVYVGANKKYSTTTNSVTADSLTAGTAYTFTVKARDFAGNTSASSTGLTVSTSSTTQGLTYKYYEGNWDVLPNFSALTPIKTGFTPNIDIITTRNVSDYYGYLWEGNITLPTSGTYTFETISDDGSKVYFNKTYSAAATALVSNDSVHGGISATGSVNMPAGSYPIAITYFEKNSGEGMQFYWTGPGIPRQLVPNSAFIYTPPVPDTTAPSAPTGVVASSINSTFINLTWNASTDNIGVSSYDIYVNGTKKYNSTTNSVTADGLTAATNYSFTIKALDFAGNASAFSASLATATTSAPVGLTYKYYEGAWDVLPNFSALTPVKTGVTPNIDIITARNQSDNYGFLWEGNITLPTSGTYTFETISDDGSKLYFNRTYLSTATATVNNDGLHGANSVTGNVTIAAGTYPIAITYFERGNAESMQVYWTGPGIPRQLIPNSAFNSTPAAPDTTAPSVPTNPAVASANSTFINLTWNASTDNVAVSSYDIYVNGQKKYNSLTNSVTADGLTAATQYMFTIKALDVAGNASAFSTVLTTSTTSAPVGLTYKYYEGAWDVLPNFSALTPIKTGVTPNIDIITARNQADNYGFLWEGNITLPTTGTYTFETISDDGSKLYFNRTYLSTATATVNNDGLHGANSVTGSVNIAAGTYPIAITYFERGNAESMQVYWTGPGIPRQLIPNSAFAGTYTPPVDNVAPTVPANVKAILTTNTYVDIAWDASTDNIAVTGYDIYVNGTKATTVTNGTNYRLSGLTAGQSNTFTIKAVDLAANASAFSTPLAVVSSPKANGLKYRYYEGDWNVLPNFDLLTALKTGSSATTDITVRPSLALTDHFGFVWEGYINITTPGAYTFETISDDGSKFYWNTLYNPAATALVNNDGLHGGISVTGTVNVPVAGLYPISITYFEKDGGEGMQIFYSGPGIARQLLPGKAVGLSDDGTVLQGSTSLATLGAVTTEEAINASLTKAFPNPFTESLHVQYNSTTAANNVSVSVYDMNGRMVQRQLFGKTSAGTNTYNIDLNKQMMPGMYLIKLDVDGKSVKMWKMMKERR